MAVVRRLLPTRFELAALLIAAGIGCFQLFVPPIVGVADNGDGFRLMQPLGLDYPSGVYAERYWSFINERYKFSEPASPSFPLVSSEFVPLRAALFLAKVAPHNGTFDIRLVGGVQLCLFLLSLWLILISARGLGLGARVGLAAALTLVCTDAGYVAYFNSFFCESIAYIALLAAIALSLLILGGRTPAVAVLAGYCLSASLLICAKPQYAVLGPPLALLGWILSRQIAGSYRAVAGGAAATLLLVISAWYLAATPSWLAAAANYNVVFFEILKNSPVPEQDAAELGLGPWAVKYAGTHAFMARIASQDPDYKAYQWARVNNIAIASFYLRHPTRLLAVANKRASRAFELVIPNQASYPQSAGLPPGQHARSFTYWNSMRSSVVPHAFVVLMRLCLALGRGNREENRRSSGRVDLYLGDSVSHRIGHG
jgi:hypothetical protein